MLLFARPSAERIHAFIESQRASPFSYPAPGATREEALAGYQADRYRVQLGSRGEAYARARHALLAWKMFDTGWLYVWLPGTPIEAGRTVAVLARHYGFWSLNACRIVYAFDEREPGLRCGFAYGTLSDHAEGGEERFKVEMRAADQSVWYEIFALSRPRGWVRAAYPLARRLQRRFGRDSLDAMRRAVGASPNELPVAR